VVEKKKRRCGSRDVKSEKEDENRSAEAAVVKIEGGSGPTGAEGVAAG
jgi:hypothetical protein